MNGDRSDRLRRHHAEDGPRRGSGSDIVSFSTLFRKIGTATPEWFILIARIEYGRDGISGVA